ncbi:unnamed protein product [Cyclocybe aegerita]|uniref:Uncharacterized protein n=1 Tax=Cyclocybe aegerita TaxID=1973307 RepID=A0A8S0X659_CYCAE|nr:unnamed protein product [Cyclocybe aegerita]
MFLHVLPLTDTAFSIVQPALHLKFKAKVAELSKLPRNISSQHTQLSSLLLDVYPDHFCSSWPSTFDNATYLFRKTPHSKPGIVAPISRYHCLHPTNVVLDPRPSPPPASSCPDEGALFELGPRFTPCLAPDGIDGANDPSSTI